jgi:hypothetical protein
METTTTPAPQKTKRLTAKQSKEIKKLLRMKQSYDYISNALGVSYNQVANVASYHGLNVFRRYKKTKAPVKPTNAGDASYWKARCKDIEAKYRKALVLLIENGLIEVEHL